MDPAQRLRALRFGAGVVGALLVVVGVRTVVEDRPEVADRAAQRDLRLVLVAQQQLLLRDGSYSDAPDSLATAMTADGSPDVVTARPGDAVGSDVSVLLSDDGVLVLAARSDSGTCFHLADHPVSGLARARDQECRVLPAASITDPEW